MLKLKEIYSGMPDAKDECEMNKFDTLSKCFVVPPNFEIEELLSGNKCFIRGYKGTGKTALLFYLDDYLRKNNSKSCVSFIYFKDFDEADKNKFEKIAKRINKPKETDFSISSELLLTIDGYLYIWKWIFLEQILRDNQDFGETLFKKDEYYKKFVQLLNIVHYDKLNKRKIQLPSEVTLFCEAEITPYNTTLRPGLRLNFSTGENGKAYDAFKNVIDDAMNCLSNMTRTDIPYYIMIDELEAFNAQQEIFKRDLYLIRDLIITVKDFNKMFKGSDFLQTKIICCIRSEILNSIYKFIPSYEINKITNGFECPLIWNYNTNNNLKHPIVQVLLKRIAISHLQKSKVSLSEEEIYSLYFDKTIFGISSIEYLLNQTWNKPRDIVRFLIAIKNSSSCITTKFTQQVFVESAEEYSRESLKEVKEELNALYTAEQIDEIFLWLSGFRTMFSLDELKERIHKHFLPSKIDKNLVEVLQDLYRVGIVGNYSKITNNFLWQHRGNDNAIFDDEWLFVVHRGLFKALGINTASNYKKYLYSTKKNLEIGEIFDAIVERVADKYILVKFTDGLKWYKGFIFIHELENFFVTTEYLYDHYYEGLEIKAELISYNEEKKNWVMSKKNVIQDNDMF